MARHSGSVRFSSGAVRLFPALLDQGAYGPHTVFHSARVRTGHLVNKPLQATGILEDNARGLKIVRKMNSWPSSDASRLTVKL